MWLDRRIKDRASDERDSQGVPPDRSEALSSMADLALDRSGWSVLTKPSDLRPAEPTICRRNIGRANRISRGQAERQSVKKMVESIAIKICRWSPVGYRPDQLPFRFAFLEDPLRRPVV